VLIQLLNKHRSIQSIIFTWWASVEEEATEEMESVVVFLSRYLLDV
jgi:hypothetical protein